MCLTLVILLHMQYIYDIGFVEMRHAASLVPRGHKNRLVLLVPNTDRDLLGVIFEVVKELDVSVDHVMPDGVDDNDIMQLACLAHWDIAFLIVNSITYPDDVSIQDGAVQLIHNLSRFERPIVACYGWPSSDAFVKDLLAAGATAAFSIPCSSSVIKEAFIPSLD
jgi:hypothetical protein